MNTTDVITRAQQRLNEIGANVEVDGIAGNETWAAVAQALSDPDLRHITPARVARTATFGSHLDELAQIAESQIGTQEDSKHTNRGDAILKYQRATNLGGQGWPWCAAFVDWCCEQLWAKHPELGRRVPRPDTASAFGLLDWGRKSGCMVFGRDSGQKPERGDLVVYEFSHCGIVSHIRDGNAFDAIEGNSNADGGRDGYAVVRHPRNFSSVRGFISIPEIRAS